PEPARARRSSEGRRLAVGPSRRRASGPRGARDRRAASPRPARAGACRRQRRRRTPAAPPRPRARPAPPSTGPPPGSTFARRSPLTCDNDLTVPEPFRCFVPDGMRTWGWTVQLPSLHSRRSWGVGDLADLRRLARWSARLGAGMLLVSPLHAPRQRLPQQASPYSPSSRLRSNPLFIAVDEVPGFARSLAPAPNPSGVRIDREGAWTAKMRALELLWARFPGDPAFDEFRERGGAALAAWAAFCLGDEGGTPGDASRLRFHEWLQWLLDEQLGS